MPSGCCCVPLCSCRGGHKFPSDPVLRKKWIVAVRRDKWEPNRWSTVCRNHFTASDYTAETLIGSRPERTHLKKGAVPSVFPWTKEEPEYALSRRLRYEERSNQVSKNDENGVIPSEDSVVDVAGFMGIEETVTTEDDDPVKEVGTQTVDCKPKYVSKETNTESSAIMSVHRFSKDDKAILYYTGLESYRKFQLVRDILGDAANHLQYMYGPIHRISVDDQLFLVLMKLRRHKSNYELATLFDLSEADVYNIFFTWIRFMSLQFKELGDWPTRDLVRFYAPTGFKTEYPTTRVIIDATEIPVKKPKFPTSQQASYSTYKNRNTVKVLVGVTPGGLVSYVSESYAGSTSDRQITERSNLTRMCDPGDSIMSDKGFDVQDLFAPCDVKVNLPTFLRNCNQFTPEALGRDRRIASKRVHVERIIGLAKTYKILTEPLNKSEVTLSSDIIYVIFMLCNFRNCIVPKYA